MWRIVGQARAVPSTLLSDQADKLAAVRRTFVGFKVLVFPEESHDESKLYLGLMES